MDGRHQGPNKIPAAVVLAKSPPRKGFGEFFPTCTYPPLGHSSYESRQKEKKIEPGFHCRLTLDQHCLNLLPLLHPGPGDG